MDCFNHFCPLRQNTTSNYNHCDYWTCQNRCEEPVIYITSDHTLTADEIVTRCDVVQNQGETAKKIAQCGTVSGNTFAQSVKMIITGGIMYAIRNISTVLIVVQKCRGQNNEKY